MQEPSSILGCSLWCWEGPFQKGAGASFQSKQLKEMQAATLRPAGAVRHCSAFP